MRSFISGDHYSPEDRYDGKTSPAGPVYRSWYSSPVGWLEIRATQQAVTALLFHNSPPPEQAGGSNDHAPLIKECRQQLGAYFQGTLRAFSLPLQQEGSGFQQQVWEELCHIPYATTLSYLQLARKIGDEKNVRAVGAANGKNNIAIIVPCHRVIGSNGKLIGYGGGLWRKQWLLEHEQKVAGLLNTLF
jgi:methylated-DNA-[protein]-cysteine S-methyltransferase